MGRPLYEKLGFKPVRRNVSFVGRFEPGHGHCRAAPGPSVPPPRPTCRRILEPDRAAFGADRGHILARLPGFADRIAVFEAIGRAGGIAGYAAAWRNHVTSTVIGPLVAADGEAAKRLVAAPGRRGAHAGPPRPGPGPRRTARLGARPRPRTGRGARSSWPTARSPAAAAPGHLFAPISVALA